MLIAVLCEAMGWDYFTYQAQPLWFTELLIRKLEIDAKKQQAVNSKARARKGI
jgi:hypothetical protein